MGGGCWVDVEGEVVIVLLGGGEGEGMELPSAWVTIMDRCDRTQKEVLIIISRAQASWV